MAITKQAKEKQLVGAHIGNRRGQNSDVMLGHLVDRDLRNQSD